VADSHLVLAFDFGLRRIGVASGYSGLQSASPLGILNAREGQPDWTEVARLLETWAPAYLVIGLPTHMDGTETDITARARKFANRLHGRFGLPVHLVDERASSQEAESYRVAAGAIDHQAAARILARWWAEQHLT
jgi:putative Holliday junction resolvase